MIQTSVIYTLRILLQQLILERRVKTLICVDGTIVEHIIPSWIQTALLGLVGFHFNGVELSMQYFV